MSYEVVCGSGESAVRMKAGVALEVFSNYFGTKIDKDTFTFFLPEVHHSIFKLYLDHLNQIKIEPNFYEKVQLVKLAQKVKDQALKEVT